MRTSTHDSLISIKDFLNLREKRLLSPFGTPSTASIRKIEEPKNAQEHRQNFAIDGDRILHSKAYTRYIGKTQVFYLIKHDHITHRVIHVQLLSKIGRTIGRLLRLNEDLIEAIALGHDIGHPPFGHDGERILSNTCTRYGLHSFQHNIQGVRFLNRLERGGRGWNLSLQVLDGILCHNGEILTRQLAPQRTKSFADFDEEMRQKSRISNLEIKPTTLEGCVVRMADVISYVGRDLEDAIRLNLIVRDELPERVKNVLGNTNGTIVYSLVEDLVQNSLECDYLAFGDNTISVLGELLNFNIERIYSNPKIKTEKDKIQRLYENLFDYFVEDITRNRKESSIFRDFLDGMEPGYLKRNPPEIVRDYIAGMTDQYFLEQATKIFLPQNLPSRF
jgi:dGTPase